MTVPAKAGDKRSRDGNDSGRNNFEIFIVTCRYHLFMSLLLAESHPIPLHAIAAMIAIILGGVQLYVKKGGVIHKLLGRIWVGLMLIVSVSSFFIHEIKLWGAYSPIHLLSIWTIFSLGLAIYFVHVGNIKRHKQVMLALYGFALILTGFFTFMPGRVMHQIAFG